MLYAKRVIARWVVVMSASLLALAPARTRSGNAGFESRSIQLSRCAVRAEWTGSQQQASGVGAARLLSQIGAVLTPLSEPNAAPPLGPAGRRLLLRKVGELLGGAMPGKFVHTSVLASAYTTAVFGYLNRVGNYVRTAPLRDRSATMGHYIKVYESFRSLEFCLRELQRWTPTRVRGRVFAKVGASGTVSHALMLIADIARSASSQHDADIAVVRIARITGAAEMAGDIPEHYALTYGPNAVKDLCVDCERETSSLAGVHRRSKDNVTGLARMSRDYLASLTASMSSLQAALVGVDARRPPGWRGGAL